MKTILKNNHLQIDILEKGAELCAIKSSNHDYMWNANPKFWSKHSPILFPIVGTLKNNIYSVNSKIYTLPRHGFARDMLFSIVQISEHRVTFELQSSAETHPIFPFDFSLHVTYELQHNTLRISFLVKNNGNTRMPFSIGAHPAFALPLDFDAYSLQFSKNEILECAVLKDDLISENSYIINLVDNNLKLNYELFDNDALIFKKIKSKKITILENEKPFISVDFRDFESLGIWTKKDAPFICIEPWNGFADNVNVDGDIFKKQGIKIIEPNQVFNCQYTITLH